MGVQLGVDYSSIEPSQGGRSYFPVSGPKGWLALVQNTEGKENSKKNGTIMIVTFLGQEGPTTGRTMEMIINLQNPSVQAMNIGAGECSAIAHATGHIRVGNSAEWHGKPVRVVVDSDMSEQYPNATRITRILTPNGDVPTRAGQQPMQGGQQQGNFAGNPGQGQPAFNGAGQVSGNPGQQQQPQFQAQPQGQQQFQPQGQQQFQPQGQGQQQFQPQGQQQFQPQGQVS